MQTIQFFQAIPQAPAPTRADKSVLGTLPTRGFRHCEPLRAASGFGWYFYPPAELAFQWDGAGEVLWWFNDEPQGRLREAMTFPGFTDTWNAAAPAELRGCAYPMLIPSDVQANLIQIWTGWLVRTPPEWSALIRPVANFAAPFGYLAHEGMIETDTWFGPLFTNIVVTNTDTPIVLQPFLPLVQLQPIPRAALRLEHETHGFDAWSDEEWARYHATVVVPNRDAHRQRGAYAIRSRQRAAGQYDESLEGEIR